MHKVSSEKTVYYTMGTTKTVENNVCLCQQQPLLSTDECIVKQPIRSKETNRGLQLDISVSVYA